MMLLMLTMMSSICFIFLMHPLSMGLLLLVQTITITLITGFMYINFWFSYILFLIMIGGMLVLFIYMTSIASNEKFKFSMKINFLLISMMVIFIIFLFFSDNMFFNLNNINSEMISSNIKMYLTLNKFLNYPSNIMLFLMIIYLFITLVAVVKITNISFGPLRQNF
uniref:NADH-ubiquinone oxidoreductase chain 6 n=1 Tax=Tachinus subterraneus TaxID=879013 RepID=A0A343C3U3_9COLE|nr:NADH dehydrogenase subunit 6 [Tachinus subterraneus]